jgi:prolipoprotein diacylglyceryl transferase
VPTVLPILASIPSPSDNSIKIGGLELRAYGLAIALGVIAAVWISRRRWAARGGDPDDISRIALWAVLAGLIGARLYHVITDHDRFEGRWLHAFAVWEGGLGIPGGLIAGVGVGAYVAHRRGLPVAQLLDVVAPALPVAQAIGRLGNWFNQELFGRPTDLPWGLEIDPAHRPAGYLNVATFHPTFLYEALWNLALAGGLVLWERHHPNSRPGRLFAYYVAGYAVGRAWVEALRIDPATRLFGVRWNIWMSLIAFVGAVGWLVFDSWRARQEAGREPSEAAVATASADTADVAAADKPAAVESAGEPAEDATTRADEPAEEAPTIEATEPAEDATAAAHEPAEQAPTIEATEPAEDATTDAHEPAEDATTAAHEPAEQAPTIEATEPAEDATTAAHEPAEETTTIEATEPAEDATTDADEPAEDATTEADEPAEEATTEADEPAQAATIEAAESAEDAAAGDASDAAEQPDAAESAVGGDTAEPSDTATEDDAVGQPDAIDHATDTSDTAQRPTSTNEPESAGATSAEPDAGEPTDAGAGQRTEPERAPDTPAEKADEEAAT